MCLSIGALSLGYQWPLVGLGFEAVNSINNPLLHQLLETLYEFTQSWTAKSLFRFSVAKLVVKLSPRSSASTGWRGCSGPQRWSSRNTFPFSGLYQTSGLQHLGIPAAHAHSEELLLRRRPTKKRDVVDGSKLWKAKKRVAEGCVHRPETKLRIRTALGGKLFVFGGERAIWPNQSAIVEL